MWYVYYMYAVGIHVMHCNEYQHASALQTKWQTLHPSHRYLASSHSQNWGNKTLLNIYHGMEVLSWRVQHPTS